MSLIAVVLASFALGGCESMGDITEMFNNKKPLPGDRKAVFPAGVPGVPQGVPPELVAGYQPPPEPPPPPVAEKPKPKPKPKAAAKPKPKPAAEQARASAVPPRQPQPAPQAAPRSQPQGGWPAPPPPRQAPQSGWPDPPPPPAR